MRQYLTPDQTAKLIELGFEKPKSSVECELPKGDWRICSVGIRKAYSIGELIEMLPKHIFPDGRCSDLQIYANQYLWVVKYAALLYGNCYLFRSKELIDALYDMIIKLKEEEVI